MTALLLWRLNLAGSDFADVHVYALDMTSALKPTSRDLAEAPKREPLRSRFFARRGFAREMVASRVGVAARDVTIGHDESGAPVVIAPQTGLHLSLAGRETFCAVAIAPRPIGVDIEPLESMAAPVCDALHPRERAALAALDDVARHEAFLRWWTAKEAYLKALRTGFSRDPSLIEIVEAEEGRFAVRDGELTPSLDAAEWRQIELSGCGFIAACVVLPAP
jgi:phosphopantetheinyl transferase